MSCAPRVRGIIEKVPGVESADVDYDTQTATVQVRGDVAKALTTAVAAGGQYGLTPKN